MKMKIMKALIHQAIQLLRSHLFLLVQNKRRGYKTSRHYLNRLRVCCILLTKKIFGRSWKSMKTLSSSNIF